MLQKLSCLSVDWPLKPEKLFPSPAPLLVEIGFGNGDYLVHLAQSRPDCNIIGLEISGPSLDRAEAKIEKRGLSNVRPIHGRAETALAHLLEPASVSEFHINFPDPWFKKRHGRRRLIRREAVELMTSRLVNGGTLLLATDIAAYANMAHEIFAAAPGLSNALDDAWARDLPGRFRTKYEQKAYREGRRAHFFLYRRNREPVTHQAVMEELEMPHLFLKSPLDAAEVAERFEASRRQFGEVNVALLHAYADVKRDAAAFEVVVAEPTIEQHALIMLQTRGEPGEYMVKLGAVGHARATWGMHCAVRAVGEWVAGLDEGAAVVEWKVRR